MVHFTSQTLLSEKKERKKNNKNRIGEPHSGTESREACAIVSHTSQTMAGMEEAEEHVDDPSENSRNEVHPWLYISDPFSFVEKRGDHFCVQKFDI